MVKGGTPCTSILLVVEGKGYNRQATGKSILLAVEGDTPCTALLVLVVVKGIPTHCTSKLQAVEKNIPCTSIDGC